MGCGYSYGKGCAVRVRVTIAVTVMATVTVTVTSTVAVMVTVRESNLAHGFDEGPVSVVADETAHSGAHSCPAAGLWRLQ